MAVDVVIPEVGEIGMDVVFVRWRKDAGDQVAPGDILFELDTEKTIVEVEAWSGGTLMDLRVSDGDIVTPRQVVARILAPGDDPSVAGPSQAAGAPSAPAGPAHTPARQDPIGQPLAAATAGPALSPRARALARELGIDTSAITGTGPGGMVTEQDVRMAAASGGRQG